MGFKAPVRGSMAFGPGPGSSTREKFCSKQPRSAPQATRCQSDCQKAAKAQDPDPARSSAGEAPRPQTKLHREFEPRLCKSCQERTGRVHPTAAALISRDAYISLKCSSHRGTLDLCRRESAMTPHRTAMATPVVAICAKPCLHLPSIRAIESTVAAFAGNSLWEGSSRSGILTC